MRGFAKFIKKNKTKIKEDKTNKVKLLRIGPLNDKQTSIHSLI